MSRTARVVTAVFFASLVASIAAPLLGASSFRLWLGGPAMLLSGWAFAGHLITVDEDMPGGWSNPEELPVYWHKSLGALLVKFVVFFAVLFVVLPEWGS